MDKAKTSRVAAWLALIVSTIAMISTIWQAIENARQNEILVRPALVLRTKVGNGIQNQGLYLSNRGFGPAKIVTFNVFYRGQQFNGFAEVMEHIYSKLGDSSFTMATGMGPDIINVLFQKAIHQDWKPGDVVAANHEEPLFYTPTDILQRRIPNLQFFRNDLGDGLIMTQPDLYGSQLEHGEIV